jgi:PAS domain S-box-containing protein
MTAWLEQLPVAWFVLQRSGGQEQDSLACVSIRAINQRALALLDPEHCGVGQPAEVLLDCVAHEARDALAALWHRSLSQHRALTWEGPWRTGTGSPRWMQLELAPAHGPNGEQQWQGVLVDMSERKAREVSLEARLDESRRLLDSVPIAIVIANLDGDDPEITKVNAEFERSFGYTHRQVPRASAWAERAYPDPVYRREVLERWFAAVEQARREQGAVTSMEFLVTNATGQQKHVLFSARVLGSELLVSLLDVSERRRAESELRSAREQLALTALEVTEAIPVGTYTMVLRPNSPMASFSYMSERFLQLTGLKREEALADPLKAFACVHPDDYDAWVRMNAEAFEKKLPFFGETRVVVNGNVRWITAESVPRELADGTTVWEGVLIDVTDRIEAQQQLQRSQAHLERILNNLPVAIAINSLETTNPEVTFLNDHFIRSLGYDRNDIRRVDDWARLAYPDPAYRQQVFHGWNAAMARAVAQKGTVEQVEYRVRSKDGRDLQMLISAVVLDDMALVALIDVTRSREAEEQLRRGIEEKLRVSLSASAVAHEISQPLSSILLNSRLALRLLDTDHPNVDALCGLLQPLVGEAERMDLITERISMLLRNVDTTLAPLDLRDVVHSAEMQVQSRLLAAGLSLECQLPERPCPLRGDAVQLQLAVVNLLRNGLDALQEAVPASPRLRLTLQQQGCWLELSVADNGAGFADGMDPSLPLTTTKSRGTGIGLYVVRLTMENHGGSVIYRTARDLGGAEVVLRLPATNRAGS